MHFTGRSVGLEVECAHRSQVCTAVATLMPGTQTRNRCLKANKVSGNILQK